MSAPSWSVVVRRAPPPIPPIRSAPPLEGGLRAYFQQEGTTSGAGQHDG